MKSLCGLRTNYFWTSTPFGTEKDVYQHAPTTLKDCHLRPVEPFKALHHIAISIINRDHAINLMFSGRFITSNLQDKFIHNIHMNIILHYESLHISKFELADH